MKDKTFRRTILMALPVFAAISGCAAFGSQGRPPLKEENVEMLSIKKSISDMDRRLEELNNKFLLLQEKVESNRELLAGGDKGASRKTPAAPAEEAPPVDTAPPEGLRVVKLKEEQKAAEPPQAAQDAYIDPESLYSRGQNLFIAGQYPQSRRALGEIVERFPSHHLADNALYWIGESYYTERNFKEALSTFTRAAEKYPEGNKAPDALLKAGYSHIELGEPEKGADIFKKLIALYPESGAAVKAEKRLKGLSTSN